MSFLDEIDDEIRNAGLNRAVALADTPRIFDWLVTTFSFQGISDRVARDYINKHGAASWSAIEASERNAPSCPKLRSYWHFEGCRYDKTSFTCAEPDHIDACPLPSPQLRNGRLNQTAYSLFLFVRDLADGDLVRWIDGQLDSAKGETTSELEAARQEALVGPLRNIYGVSDKILMMTLSTLLIGARKQRPIWFETGKAMISVDTLVHNWLIRTGILHDCGIPHAYGAACYGPSGCAEIIRTVADRIDARAWNPEFPKRFARWVQNAIWRFCAGDGLNLCNGNRIDDRRACQIGYCHLYQRCSRTPLKSQKNTI
ncbi:MULTISPECIES: hypothetical protein [Bradyrhizobium]|uniref:hypothetical protein n=1 Tax=Bradyrhizobium TaxID=374 RepID=UPI00155EDFC6|nr:MULTISPECIES: hypothetical protein [Bradyrhizobium]MDD1520671.1 hypothetical protein [Bradyrhizobium sp. WBAH30]MDD1545723.1 hypothetical protein [Bradyrhizobium sp. WBAH41]MDD1559016.1 hypothetical protein [Bradyrhizobium sp. WBAH23]MDD1566333.1 hypothetical protein [Bradyrhizobium sp. WBAH33]MDD1591927.1 hypothetical protein [Bradyrhizobium sp. WBAH42]